MSHPYFTLVRPDSDDQIPVASAAYVDVHLLDMNHAWQNAGHDSIVAILQRIADDCAETLAAARLKIRLISYDVRNRLLLPVRPEGAALFVGTGGPGHVDPRFNLRDDLDRGQILESPDWESPLFSLFDQIAANDDAMLYGICHTYGLMCRWSGVADPVLRSAAKGGPSIGVVENVLTSQALTHPWFAQLASFLPDGVRLPVADSRHYDLIPRSRSFGHGITPIAYEARTGTNFAGEAMTMCEFVEPRNGRPRIFGVNHHPEIPNAIALKSLLDWKFESGEVSREWYVSRLELLDSLRTDDHNEALRLLAADYSLGFLLRHALSDLVNIHMSTYGIHV